MVAKYDGQYNDTINSYFNSLFGRDAAEEGLNYWGGALSDPTTGITLNNLQQSLIDGASGDDLSWYNANVLNQNNNTGATNTAVMEYLLGKGLITADRKAEIMTGIIK